MECSNCGKRALFHVTDGDNAFYLCLDCNLKYEQAQQLEFDRNAQLLNMLGRQIDIATGIPGLGPRMPIPNQQFFHVGDSTLTNIRVDGGTIGVLNTGSIGSVDAAVTVMKKAGDSAAAKAISSLTQAVVDSAQADAAVKNQILDILSVLSAEITAPKKERRKGAMLPLLSNLATLLSGVADLAQLWTQFGPALTSLFT